MSRAAPPPGGRHPAMEKRKAPEIIKRAIFLVCGVFVTAFGLAATVKASLGISPVTTLAYALNQVIPGITIGMFTFFQHCVFFILTVLLLRREFKPYQLLILPSSFVFGRFIDLSGIILRPLPLPNYFAKIALLLISCVIVGLGFSMIITSGYALDANTAFLNALSYRLKQSYSKWKVITDIIIVALAALVGLVFLHKIVGIREGTLIAALIIGPIVGFFNPFVGKIERFFRPKGAADPGEPSADSEDASAEPPADA